MVEFVIIIIDYCVFILFLKSPLRLIQERAYTDVCSGIRVSFTLTAAYYDSLCSCFVLELYFDVDWHLALLFVLFFYSVAKLSAPTTRIVNIF